MAQYLCERRVDVLDCTPTQWMGLMDAGLLEETRGGPRIVLLGGEPVSEALWGRLSRARHMRFYNLYGPTECTVDATCARVGADCPGATIGRPSRTCGSTFWTGSSSPCHKACTVSWRLRAQAWRAAIGSGPNSLPRDSWRTRSRTIPEPGCIARAILAATCQTAASSSAGGQTARSSGGDSASNWRRSRAR